MDDLIKLVKTYRPGSMDTSLISTDNINNPRTMNAVYDFVSRMGLARQLWHEKLAGGESDAFYTAKIQTATYYANNVLTQYAWLQKQIVEGSGDVMAGSDEMFDVERRALVTA